MIWGFVSTIASLTLVGMVGAGAVALAILCDDRASDDDHFDSYLVEEDAA